MNHTLNSTADFNNVAGESLSAIAPAILFVAISIGGILILGSLAKYARAFAWVDKAMNVVSKIAVRIVAGLVPTAFVGLWVWLGVKLYRLDSETQSQIAEVLGIGILAGFILTIIGHFSLMYWEKVKGRYEEYIQEVEEMEA